MYFLSLYLKATQRSAIDQYRYRDVNFESLQHYTHRDAILHPNALPFKFSDGIQLSKEISLSCSIAQALQHQQKITEGLGHDTESWMRETESLLYLAGDVQRKGITKELATVH